MRNYRAWFCIAATCTLGCSNLANRVQAPFLPASQVVTATSLKPAPAKIAVNTPEIRPVNRSSAKPPDAEIVPYPLESTLTSQTPPTFSQKDEGEVAVGEVPRAATKFASEEAFHGGVRQVVRAVFDVECKLSDDLLAALLPARLLVKEIKKHFVQHQGGTRQSGLALAPNDSKKIWYCLAWITGAVFTSILAPLIVDLIRLRIGMGRPQPERLGPPPQVGPG